MEVKEYCLQRLDFNEEVIHEATKKLQEVKKELEKLRFEVQFDVKTMNLSKSLEEHESKLLSSEKYRIEYAMSITRTLKEAASLLSASERTLYRKRKEYNL